MAAEWLPLQIIVLSQISQTWNEKYAWLISYAESRFIWKEEHNRQESESERENKRRTKRTREGRIGRKRHQEKRWGGNLNEKGGFYRSLLAVTPTEAWFFVAGRAHSMWEVSSLLSRKRKNYNDWSFSVVFNAKVATLDGIFCLPLVICFQTSWFLYLATGLELLRVAQLLSVPSSHSDVWGNEGRRMSLLCCSRTKSPGVLERPTPFLLGFMVFVRCSASSLTDNIYNCCTQYGLILRGHHLPD